MNWKHSLGRRKFNAILLASILEMVVGVLMSLIDTAVTGHVIGTIGLSAMNMVAPITGFTIFSESLFSVGTSMLYARYAGRYEQEKADRALGTGILMSLAVGLITSVSVSLILPPYLSYMGVSEEIRSLVSLFMRFIVIEMAVKPLYELFTQMVFADGDEVLGTVASISETVLNLILSVLLGLRMGMTGISLATLLSTLIAFALLCLHLVNDKNTLHPRFSPDTEDIRWAALAGANDSAMFFLLPVMFFIVTKFIILRIGEYYLPVLTVINCILELTVVFEATGEAMRPILPIYVGDRNTDALRNLLTYSLGINMLAAILFSALLLAFGGLIPLFFDIEDPHLFDTCRTGLRIFAVSCPGSALVAEFNSYYLNTGRPRLAFFENVLNQLVSIVLLVLLFGSIWGINGIWWGFALAPYLTAAVFFGTLNILYRLGRITSILPQRSDCLFFETVNLDSGNFMDLVYRADAFLRQHTDDTKQITHLILTLEESLILIRDKNRAAAGQTKKKDTWAECCITVNNDGLNLSIWDSGIVFDITDTDSAITDLRSYFVSRILTSTHSKKHLVATSFNRNFFHFDSSEQTGG